MRVKVIGGGWYGCHLSTALLADGHDVVLHEIADQLFAGASGKIPARLHLGSPHYPRSHVTRQACLQHNAQFLDRYGFLTRGVKTNIYAIAQDISLVDFGTYRQILKSDIECLTIYDPGEYGLLNVEGAMLTAERHILCDAARDYFTQELDGHAHFNTGPDEPGDWDSTIDATFCANSDIGVSRYEPCLVLALEGKADMAVTLMDFPEGASLYPWDGDRNLCSLSSAKYTPFSKNCKTYADARAILDNLSRAEIEAQGQAMIDSMAFYYPAVREYRIADYMLSIRAMPLSGADSRLVDVRQDGKTIRIRAGKIDAIIAAEHEVKRIIGNGKN